MATGRQLNGQVAAEIVRHFSVCVSCGHKNWKSVAREQQGIDLQCKACGRFAESEGQHCETRPKLTGLTRIPGGSLAVRQRQAQQGYKVDLYVTAWNDFHEFVVRGLTAEELQADMIHTRMVLSGSRAGYVMCELDLSCLGDDVFPILASRLLPPPSGRPPATSRARPSTKRTHGLDASTGGDSQPPAIQADRPHVMETNLSCASDAP